MLQIIAEQLSLPVDEELFLRCWNLYTSFASPAVAGEHAKRKRQTLTASSVVGFDDMPSDAGLVAVTKELRARNTSKAACLSVTMRVMFFERVLEAKDRFAPWIVVRTDDKATDVAEALVRACARARVKLSDGNLLFDLDDVEIKAREIQNSSWHPLAGLS